MPTEQLLLTAGASLLASLIGGLTVAFANHLLGRRKDLLLRRELYREIIYREKISAYRDVHRAGVVFLHYFDFPDDFLIRYGISGCIDAMHAFRQAIDDGSLFMPDNVFGMARLYEEVTKVVESNPAGAKRMFELDFDPDQDLAKLLAGKEECLRVLEILKQDLGIDVLTKNLPEFFKTAKTGEKIGDRTVDGKPA